MRVKFFLISLSILISCSTSKNEFKKYDLESGIVTYSLQTPLKENLIIKRVYFSNYGATEYFEFVNDEDFPAMPILKKDSLEYIFVGDSMAIKNDRGFDTVFEKLTKREDSKLENRELVVLRTSDTTLYGKRCDLMDFKIKSTGQNGKAALWKGIPIWVSSKWEKGLYENISLIELDLKSEIPVEKTKIMDFVDVE